MLGCSNRSPAFALDNTGRCTRQDNGNATYALNSYDTADRITEIQQGSTTTAVYTHGDGLIRKDSEVPLFDGQGTERTVTNGSQTVVGTLNLDAFGNSVLPKLPRSRWPSIRTRDAQEGTAVIEGNCPPSRWPTASCCLSR